MAIVLLILKIIGIVLLCLLALVLLVLAALLFAPFRYEVKGDGDKDGPKGNGDVKVRWLLRIVSFHLIYEMPKEPQYTVRVFGIPVKRSEPSKEEEKTEEEKAEEAKPEAANAGTDETEPEAVAGTAETTETADAEQKPEAESKPEGEEKPDDKPKEEAKEELPEELSESLEGKKKGKLRGLWEKITGKAKSLFESLEAMLILFDKKKGLLEKYIQKKSTAAAVKKTWTYAVWILKHIAPKKYYGSAEFGTDDPAVTGEICAAISPWYPLISDYVALTPVFENRLVIKGDICLKGRIRLWGILLRAFKLWRDKNVRKVLKEAEKVKETLMKTPDECKEIFTKAA